METIEQYNIENNKILAIVACSVLYEFDNEMLERVGDKYAVINFFNFNDGLKDNIEGITVIGILTDLDTAKIVFRTELRKFQGVIIATGKESRSGYASMTAMLAEMSRKGMVIVTGDQSEKIEMIDLNELPERYKHPSIEEIRKTMLDTVRIPPEHFGPEQGSKYHK